ncbi:MAG: NmrA family NAD(P)-binding protein [Verrucomicrobia bacterium]|nr:NmrA family NAD(P)-binding protein [Cytophagales bacterium]
MPTIFVTGASGNVGLETLKSLLSQPNQADLKVIAGVRDIAKAESNVLENIEKRNFDFETPTTFGSALQGIDGLFLLRPPQLSAVKKYFQPLIEFIKSSTSIKHVVFLSVQGAEKSRFIPHYKIEKLLIKYQIPYTFLRPGYFMQNFTTTLKADIKNRKIVLPAGNAKFNLTDVADIAKVAAKVLIQPEKFLNQAYEITGSQNYTFTEMAAILSEKTGKNILYEAVSPIDFFFIKRKEGMKTAFILVMIVLHYLPRFQAEPQISQWIEKITGDKPTNFEDFALKLRDIIDQ